MSLTDAATSARLLGDALNDLDTEVAAIDPEGADLHELLTLRESLAQAQRDARDVFQVLEHRIGETMGRYQVEVDGFGRVRRHPRRSVRNGDNEALLAAVLDSRLTDRTTGEIVDETPFDKVRHVWGLGVSAARVGSLKARDIQLDEFAEVETRGFVIQVNR